MLRVEHKRHYLHDRQPVARYLVSRGCQTDILMAAALGDVDLAQMLLAADPECVRTRVEARSVYASMLGERRTAHSVASDFGHEDVFQLLMRHTPADLRFELACELGEEATIQEIARLSLRDPVKLPDAARSNNTSAVRLMLAAGWPIDARGEMGATALHWAAFNGNAEMTREILKFHPALELKSLEQESTAFDWAVFGSGNSWHSETGDYAGTVQWHFCKPALDCPRIGKNWNREKMCCSCLSLLQNPGSHCPLILNHGCLEGIQKVPSQP